MLAIAGAIMVFEAVRSYFIVVPQSTWVLYIYVPIGMLLFAPGVVLIARAQARYNSERRRPPSPQPPARA
jgi:4-amino-4-deoxy-L-arabinose transferase-like glycosyltransferase